MTPYLLILLLSLGAATPPQVQVAPPATYPGGHNGTARVVLDVTVGTDGHVQQAEVYTSDGDDFSQAALGAVRQWIFMPAQQDGGAVVARVRVPFEFSPPPPPPQPTPTLPPPLPPPSTQKTAPPTTPGSIDEVSVRGYQQKIDRGGSDFQLEVGNLAPLVAMGASDILQLAPGILVGNEGGAGHADQVFLRGFNAEQGQAIEFTVNGVPINEVDNTDGHGYADTHFIIPELVRNVRIIEGPFDPHQGDFAEAGSADYELGVAQRGLRLEAWLGSFATRRLLLLYAPPQERQGTFAAAELWTSAGYGVNRANSHASAMAQYEGTLGQRGLYRILLTSYATHYKAAGVVRQDDFEAGRVSFFGTQDPSQGGDAQRYTVAFDLENPLGLGVLKQQAFLTYRSLRILENFTGFLLDAQELGQALHPQRGDGVLQSYTAFTLGSRSSYRMRLPSWQGLEQAVELGSYARFDHTLPRTQRLRFGTQIPYLTDSDQVTDIFNLAAYVDLELNLWSWLTLRGGGRVEFFSYNVQNLCATAGNYARNQPLDQSCPAYDSAGSRLPQMRSSAAGSLLEPKVTLLLKMWPGVSATGSFGVGAQSIDSAYISQEENAPFATLHAFEAGLLYGATYAANKIEGRALGFQTNVSQDLIFDPQLGRLSTASGTTRRGAVALLRLTGLWLDVLASFTYAHATFDDTGDLVPYVPSVIARVDALVHHSLPVLRLQDAPFWGTLGAAVNFIGERALPFGEATSPTAALDLTASLRWTLATLGLHMANVLNTQYPMTQFFYASDFHSRPYPTLVPTAHFTAAAPRSLFVTLSINLEEDLS